MEHTKGEWYRKDGYIISDDSDYYIAKIVGGPNDEANIKLITNAPKYKEALEDIENSVNAFTSTGGWTQGELIEDLRNFLEVLKEIN